MENNSSEKKADVKNILAPGMKKKIAIAIGVLAVLFAGYVVVARGQMKKNELAADGSFASVEKAYKDRMELLANFMNAASPLMAGEKKTFSNFDKYEKTYKEAQTVEDKVTYINKMEGEVQDAMAALGDYPDALNNQSVSELKNKIDNDNTFSAPKKTYNDAVAQYNMTIVRIRYRMASAILGNQPLKDLKTISELEKISQTNRKKAAEKASAKTAK